LAFERLTFIDIKTTGPDPRADAVIDFAAVRYVGARATERFASLANPGRPIPPHVTALTGITQSDVDNQPGTKTAARQFMDFLKDDTIVAHHAPAVQAFLKSRPARRLGRTVLDSHELARIVLPTLEHHDLDTLAHHLGAKAAEKRRAEADAVLVADIWQALIEKLAMIDLAVLQTINRIAGPIDWSLKPIFAHTEQAKIRNFTDTVEWDMTETLRDFSDILKELRSTKPDTEDQPHRRELDIDWIGGLFESDGPLAQHLPAYEPRSQQVQMARAVADAYNRGRHVMIEAGTGTGKSLAYLAPSIFWAKWNNEKIVISTNTKNLQEQLFHNDIPLIEKVLDEPFKAALIKGRANYLCVRRFRYTIDQADRELSNAQRLDLIPIITWAAQTHTGEISENTAFLRSRSGDLWNRLYSAGTECFGRACPYFRRCFLTRARTLALTCDIVIANHAVVFSEIGLSSPVLPEYRRLVFDEAQNIENVATEHLSRRVNAWRFQSLLDRLYRRVRAGPGRGLLANILFRLRLSKRPTDEEKHLVDELTQCLDLVDSVRVTGEGFLRSLANAFPTKREDRIRCGKADRQAEAWVLIDQRKQQVVGALSTLTTRLKRVHAGLDDLSGDRDFQYRLDLKRELGARVEDCEELCGDIEFVSAGEDEDYVYWVECNGTDPTYAIAAAPIDISQVMSDYFYDRKESIVLCSATLTANGRFDFVKERIGAAAVNRDRLAEYDLGSPFDYNRQVLLCVPTFLPEPGPQAERFETALAGFLVELHLATKGRGLILFTSYNMLNAVYTTVHRDLQSAGLAVLGQGFDGERDQITAIFRRVIHSVLLGTHSFWEGVDLPGETLSCLTIAKLPFAVFTDPIVDARCKAIEKSGRNAFTCYSVPAAVIRLRQGFGRLIRHRTDRGVIIVTDKRIVTRRYGRQFLNSLPARHRVFADKHSMIRTISQFLDSSHTTARGPGPP